MRTYLASLSENQILNFIATLHTSKAICMISFVTCNCIDSHISKQLQIIDCSPVILVWIAYRSWWLRHGWSGCRHDNYKNSSHKLGSHRKAIKGWSHTLLEYDILRNENYMVVLVLIKHYRPRIQHAGFLYHSKCQIPSPNCTTEPSSIRRWHPMQ
jgi:hypothetical protein